MDQETVTEYRVRVILEERTSTYETNWEGRRKKVSSRRFTKFLDHRSNVFTDLEQASEYYDAAGSLVNRYSSPEQAARTIEFVRRKFFGWMTPADPDRLKSVARSIRLANRKPEKIEQTPDGRYLLTLGVRGASNLRKKSFDSLEDAVDRLEKWAASNSAGDYYGNVRDAEQDGKIVERRN